MKASASSVVLLLSLAANSAAQSSTESTLPPVDTSAEPQSGVRAGFWWADYDRDGLDDAFVVGADGSARLLHNSGDGSFADATLLTGLDDLGLANFAAWQDFDRDGAPDLFVGAQSGPGHLMRNAGDGTFQDVTQFVGITQAGRALAAQWFDYDLDGFVDFAVRTGAGEHLYHALPNGHFEAVDLGSLKPRPVIELQPQFNSNQIESGATAADSLDKDGDKSARRRPAQPPLAGGTGAPTSPTRTLTAPPAQPPGGWLISACPPGIMDTATSVCLQASSVPTLGMLFPLTINLNVNGAGNVGIGTTTPGAKLDVAGTARISNTLTLNPASDQALNVNSGSIYKNGVLFAHTKGGSSNTAVGKDAMNSVTNGSFNTANGYRSMQYNTTGGANTAVGEQAMRMNTFGTQNTAVASYALRNNTSGRDNTAIGYQALFTNSTGNYNTTSGTFSMLRNTTGSFNTASGHGALASNTTGAENAALGGLALFYNTTGSSNTAVGMYALRNNTIGAYNTATGHDALHNNSSGSWNAADGFKALQYNTTGSINTASGTHALQMNSTGYANTAVGHKALNRNIDGFRNTASGRAALYSNTSGFSNSATGDVALPNNTVGFKNTSMGYASMYLNTSGYNNIAIGAWSGYYVTTGNSNIAIGSFGAVGESGTIRVGNPGWQTKAFIAGIRGVTTGTANAIPVLIDSNGQLGTVSSSRRFKKNIRDMGDATSRLFELRPVLFDYKEPQSLPDGSAVPPEYGLIAEEVAEIFPDLVVYDDEGKPFTVKYHILSSMLLNEMQKQDLELRRQALENAEQAKELTRLRALETRLAALEARTFVAGEPATRAIDER